MKIGIIGTRGIPNRYGGFEQFAQYASIGLVRLGHEVTVYCSSCHSHKQSEWNGVRLSHHFDPEHKIGTIGQFIYDWNCIMHARRQSYDIILQLGYTSSSIWWWFLPKDTVVVTNMDGLEWKRTKFGKMARNFLKRAERWAVYSSDYLIADSKGIQVYLKERYGYESSYIPYGADVPTNVDERYLRDYCLTSFRYNMLIARLEPENNLEIILEGASQSSSNQLPLLVIGNHMTTYGNYLKRKFSTSNVLFLGAIYDLDCLNSLRFYSNLYFHGHSVGGTNPSLLEAMASSALICAHDNIFNRSILGDDAFYFSESMEVRELIEVVNKERNYHIVTKNLEKIHSLYSWSSIISQYQECLTSCFQKGKRSKFKFGISK